MEKEFKDEVLGNIDEIVDIIKKSDLYKDYNYLSLELSKNEEITSLIKEIKQLQQEIMKTNNMDLENKIKDKEKKLSDFSIYTDFIEVQSELNNLFQIIRNSVEDNFIIE